MKSVKSRKDDKPANLMNIFDQLGQDDLDLSLSDDDFLKIQKKIQKCINKKKALAVKADIAYQTPTKSKRRDTENIDLGDL